MSGLRNPIKCPVCATRNFALLQQFALKTFQYTLERHQTQTMVNQPKRSMTKADMISALRSRGVRGRLTSMRKGELYKLGRPRVH